MKHRARLQTLQMLTRIMRERDAARLAALKRTEKDLQEELVAWTRASTRGATASDAAIAVASWQRVGQRHRARTAEQILALDPDLAAARQQLRQSFGRQQALKAVVEKAARKARGPAGRYR